MPADSIDDLLDAWEEAAERGESISAEELCRECPELKDQVQAKISALQAMDVRLSGDQVSSSSSDEETLNVNSEITGLAFHAKGGLGAVYRATERELNREVAVKFIHRNLVHNAESRQRFSLEAEVTGRLEHPGVVPLYGLGRADNGRLFYYMRYIDGQTLDEAILRFHQQRDRLNTLTIHSVDFRKLLTSFVSVCRTVAYAHNRGIVHRDIKPANVMLGKYGETIVVDWGLAVPVARDDRFRSSGEASLMPTSGSNTGTTSGAGIGTPSYMSPEQMSGLAPTPASDIYSLGATLYKILTGQPSVGGDNAAELKKQVLEGDFPRPRDVVGEVPQELQAVCLKAMALQPTHRYQTALELADDIDNYLADVPVTAFAEPFSRKIARWMGQHKTAAQAIVLAVAAIVLITSVSAFYMTRLANDEHAARKLAVEHSKAAEEARIQNLKLSAGFLARATGYEIDRHWRLLETEVRSETLRKLLNDANSDPQNAEIRQNLQNWLNDRKVLKEKAVVNTGWALLDANGIQVARAPREPSIGNPYRHRDYFHGLGRDLTPDDPRRNEVKPFQYVLQKTTDQEAVYMSCIFESTNTQTLFVAFTAAVWDTPAEETRRNPIGVFSIPLEISDFELPTNAMLFQLDDDPFEERPGLVISHPSLGRRSEEQLPPRVSQKVIDVATLLRAERLRQIGSVAPVESTANGFIADFQDPVTNEVSPAAIEPVIVPGRPKSIGDTGWFVVVRELAADDPAPEK